MYVLEYLIYHLRPYGAQSSQNLLQASTNNTKSLLKAAYEAAILNMGADDVFKKNVTDIDRLMRLLNRPKAS